MPFKIFNILNKRNNKPFSYFKYAIGEIVLVAIGILIALNVNNLNQSRLEVVAMKSYLKKIKSNIENDILESQRLLNFRIEHTNDCNEVSQMLIDNDFSNQAKIQKSITEMIIEVQLNFNNSAFESLKNSGYLQHLKNENLEQSLYNYYDTIDEIVMFEIDQRNWANHLELELDKNGFIYEWTQLEKIVHTDLFSQISFYDSSLKNHPGHKIIMRLLFRGGTNTSILTKLYESSIISAQNLVKEIDFYLETI